MRQNWRSSYPHQCSSYRTLITVSYVPEQVEELATQLRGAGVRVKTDTRDHQTPGWKYNYWELKVGRCRPNQTSIM